MEVGMPSSIQECGVREIYMTMGPAKLSEGQKRKMRWRRREMLRDEQGGVTSSEGKVEVLPQNSVVLTEPSNKHPLGMIADTNATVAEKGKVSKKRKRQKSKRKAPTLVEILEANGEGSVATLGATSVASKRKAYMKVANREMLAATTTALDTKGMASKREDYVENYYGGIGLSTAATLNVRSTMLEKIKENESKNKIPTSVDIQNTSLNQEDTENANGVLRDNPLIIGLPMNSPLQDQKLDVKIAKTLSQKLNIENVEVLHETGSGPVSTLDANSIASKREKYMEVSNGGELSVTPATLGANIPESKRVEYIEAPDDGLGSTPTATLDVMSAELKKKKKKKSKKKRPTSVDILNTSLNKEDTENGSGKQIEGLPTASPFQAQDKGMNVDETLSEKMNIENVEVFRDTVSGPTSTLDDNCIASTREEYMEVADAEKPSATAATLNANNAQTEKEEYIEAPDDGMCSSPTAIRDVKSTASKKRTKKKSKEKKATVGDILNTSVDKEETETADVKLPDAQPIEVLLTDSLFPGCQEMEMEVKTLSAKMSVEKVEIFGETGSDPSATLDAKNIESNKEVSMGVANSGTCSTPTSTLDENGMESKGELFIGTVDGKTGSSINVAVDANGEVSTKRKKKKSKKNKPTVGDIVNSSVNKENTEKLITENVIVPKVQNLVSSLNGSVDNHWVQPETRPTSGENFSAYVVKDDSEIANNKLPIRSLVHGFQQESSRYDGTPFETMTTGNTEIRNQNAVLSCLEASAVPYGLQPKSNVAGLRKKLIILDVNGLLADIVTPPPKGCIPDFKSKRRSLFKRPFLDEFLSFCFERFDVAIWSSRRRDSLEQLVPFLLGRWTHELLFVWDMSHCTKTEVRTLENRHKCIVFKRLKKIWEEDGPGLRWEKGYYDESNTLLLDDSPYKALINPKHSGVFPVSYSYKDKNDNLLGPGGELRVFLEGLADAENMKTYVEKHRFGQPPIDETSPDWAFYSGLRQRFINHTG